jgi:DNA-binding transcriptional ArsR family regulator
MYEGVPTSRGGPIYGPTPAADVYAAVADSTRRGMLDLLAQRQRRAGELGAAFPELSQPAISRHLRVLREAGLVEVEAKAQQRIYTLRADRLRELDRWVGHYRPLWDDRPDALSNHLASILSPKGH